MDAQYPFASRDDIWRVFEELKELHATQFEQAERISRLERRRDEDAKLRSVWSPLSPFPSSLGAPIPTEPVFHSPMEAFKGFDQGQHHGAVSTMGLDSEDEPRRGTSRANSVRFDESAIHGYYGQTNRSSSELPLRSSSGMGSLPLIERSLSHRSDGRQSSSGHSHHSIRTNSLGLETTSRMMSSIMSDSPLIPPPGLFLLGPVPAIIRCWLTTNFTNDSLLYAAVCSGSYTSLLGYPMVQKYGLEDHLVQEGDLQFIKLPMYLPEASVHQASSRSSSPVPQVPTLTIRFLVRPIDLDDSSIQIILGSDILRAHNADVLFSQDKVVMVDDERNKISIPLVRPEDDSVFKSLETASRAVRSGSRAQTLEPSINSVDMNGHSNVGVIGKPIGLAQQTSTSAPSSVRLSMEESENFRPARFSDVQERAKESDASQAQVKAAITSDTPQRGPPKAEPAGVWGSWKRDTKPDANASGAGRPSHGRTMKVLRPSKPVARNTLVTTGSNSSTVEVTSLSSSQPASAVTSPDGSRGGKQLALNPIGGASAFPWLNSS